MNIGGYFQDTMKLPWGWKGFLNLLITQPMSVLIQFARL